MTTEERDREEKWLSCLGCSTPMWTTRTRRFCSKCQRRNEATPTPKPPHHVHIPRWELLNILHSFEEIGGDSL